MQPLHLKESRLASGIGELDSGLGGDYESEVEDDYDDDDGMPTDGLFGDEDDEETKQKNKLGDEHKMLCTPLVRGYAFKEKMWYGQNPNLSETLADPFALLSVG